VALIITDYLDPVLFPVGSMLHVLGARLPYVITPEFPAGALRIGGDSPSGLVLVGGAPAARVVDLFDRATRTFIATTTSSGAGTYAFTDLAAQTDGYDVIIRGVISSGELDVIIPGVHPG